MNSLRNKLIASVTMLAVAAIMLTSASFAWYTVSTSGEVQKVKVEMEATKNLEIARATTDGVEPAEVQIGDSGDETKWGSKITTWGTVEKVQLPASASQTKLLTATYGEDGRVASEASMAEADYTTMANGISYGHADVGSGIGDKYVAVSYGVWLRSNMNLADVVGNIDTSAVEDATAKNAVRAFFYDGTNYTPSGETFELEENEPKFIQVVVFFDGDVLHAEDVVDELVADNIKVTFTSATIDAANTP